MMPTNKYWRAILACGALLALVACFDDRDRPTVPVFGELTVLSDPAGAQIALDGRQVEGTTPTTLSGIAAGEHILELGLSVGGVEFFGWADTVTVPEEARDTVDAALEGGCSRNCPFLMDNNRVRCRSNSLGDTCADVFYDAVPALEWPGSSAGSYGGGGRLLIAGILADDAGPQAGDTVAVDIFDNSPANLTAWLSRRPVDRSTTGRRQTMVLEYWATSRFRGEFLQGLRITQTLEAIDSATVRDILFIRYDIENVSADERYRRLYPWIPEGGYTFRELYLGYGLDADVGDSEQDLGTFDPQLDLSFMYDAFFQDEELGSFAERPALVGIVTAQPPAGASERNFSLWRRGDDWDEPGRRAFGWRLLAGRLAPGDPLDDHPSPEIGFVSDMPNDYRLVESHGPLELAPGESIGFSVALLLAEPVPGTFTPGLLVEAGDPTDTDRAILDVAADLRALAAQVPALWDRYRP